jgi:uncharacterized protein (TIGR02246 family)
MQVRSIGTSVVMVMLCASTVAHSQDLTRLKTDIEARLARHGVALVNSDVAAALSLYADDAIVRPANMEPVRGKDNLRTFFAQWFAAMKIRDVTYTTEEFEILGEKALHIGTYKGTIELPGAAPVADRGSFTVVWKRQPDGAWLYHRGIFNSSLPAAQTVTPKK